MTVNVRRKRRYTISRVSRIPPVRTSTGSRLYILLTGLSAAGVLTGALCFDGGFDIAPSMDAVRDMTASLGVMGAYILVCFLCGLTAFGEPAGWLLCLFKGMGAGFLAAAALGTDIKTALCTLPFEAAGLAALIPAARENIRMSRLIRERAFGKPEQSADGKECLRLYFLKFGIIAAAGACAALLDGLMSAAAGLF